MAGKTICTDPNCGGLGIKNFVLWNQAAALKQLWAISFKKNILWVKWVYAYYIRGKPLLSYHIPNEVSWMLRKIMGMRDKLVELGG